MNKSKKCSDPGPDGYCVTDENGELYCKHDNGFPLYGCNENVGCYQNDYTINPNTGEPYIARWIRTDCNVCNNYCMDDCVESEDHWIYNTNAEGRGWLFFKEPCDKPSPIDCEIQTGENGKSWSEPACGYQYWASNNAMMVRLPVCGGGCETNDDSILGVVVDKDGLTEITRKGILPQEIQNDYNWNLKTEESNDVEANYINSLNDSEKETLLQRFVDLTAIGRNSWLEIREAENQM